MTNKTPIAYAKRVISGSLDVEVTSLLGTETMKADRLVPLNDGKELELSSFKFRVTTIIPMKCVDCVKPVALVVKLDAPTTGGSGTEVKG